MFSYEDAISHCESKNSRLIAIADSSELPLSLITDLYATGLDLIWINKTSDAIEEIVNCLDLFRILRSFDQF